jgi:D-alanyl-D-alanine carboxypeptidase
MTRFRRRISLLLGPALLLAACGVTTPNESPPPSATPTAAPTRTATPEPSVAGRTMEPIGTKRPSPSETAGPTAAPTLPPPPPPTAQPTQPQTGGLPACAYADVLTFHAALDEWWLTLVDTTYMVGPGYAPGDLVDTGALGLNGGQLVRSFLGSDLQALAADAAAAGAPLRVVSGYRDYATQQATFDYWVSVGGYEQALLTSARAGHSEHQLGTTLDFTDASGTPPWNYADWATTAAGGWMRDNAWRYGFVLSYPAGATDRTCYAYEPWHYRYVGRDVAAEIAASGVTPREYLWPRQ